MPVDTLGVLAGGAIGLIGGLGGVFLGHVLTSRRDSTNRKIDGLRQVMVELGKRSRLALHFDQHVNLGLRTMSVDDFAQKVFELPGWKEATHELQETNWKFPCMAYLPEAIDDFRTLDRQIAYIMDPYADAPTAENEKSRKQAIEEFWRTHKSIQAKVERRLAVLV